MRSSLLLQEGELAVLVHCSVEIFVRDFFHWVFLDMKDRHSLARRYRKSLYGQ